jgi:hypothetical protein
MKWLLPGSLATASPHKLPVLAEIRGFIDPG